MQLTQLIDELNKLVTALPERPERTLVLGYSGGVDSEVLAFVLSKYIEAYPEINTKLVYVHHGLSENADDWQRHCQHQAEQYQLPFVVRRVDVKKGARLSIESEARKVRYQALKQELPNSGDVLLTAHHQDDQLETILLALKRGQGTKGLAAMAQVQPLDEQCWQIRPLLNYSKDEIVEFASKNSLNHIEDESNQDTKFDRNFLRQDIIPHLKQRWSAIAETASRSALLCRQQEELLSEVTEQKLQQHLGESKYAETVLNLETFRHLSLAWQRQLFRAFILRHSLLVPSMVQLDQAIGQVINAKTDAKVELKFSDLLIRRFRNQVFVSELSACAEPENIDLGWADVLEQKPIVLSDGRQLRFTILENGSETGIRLPTNNEKVSIRFNVTGSYRCHPTFRSQARSLKKLWQELSVPPWGRSKVPMLFFNENLMAAVGLWIEKSAVSTDKQSLTIKLI